ncbi:hypothetical protein P154DRAFT_582454 [Amniculicola lignicola CBS 123094]|uniref:Uncharacterized protein n=1 Tax=Amniculicola lignicola CBS 123094 TaxID=1392246 RepID=A0A6A5VW68_9PLEO|nr:hypothetical protein P154DRAFT_582454 [Amniculicola lignicola CBS 123094]
MSSTRLRTRASTLSLRLTTHSPRPQSPPRSHSQPGSDSPVWFAPRVATPRLGGSFAGDIALDIPPVPPLSFQETDIPSSPVWDSPQTPQWPLLNSPTFDRKSLIVSDVHVHQPEGLGWRHSTVSTISSFSRSSVSTITSSRRSSTSTVTPRRVSTASTITPSSEDRKRKANDSPSPTSIRRCSIIASRDRHTSLRMEPEHIGWSDLQSPVRLYFADEQEESATEDELPEMKRRRVAGWLTRSPKRKSKMRTVQV